MKAHTLPPAAGWRWLTGGYAIYRRNPLMLLLLVTYYWIVLLLLNLLPLVGPVLASLALPGLAVGVMHGCRDIDDGKPVAPGTLFSGFRSNRRGILILGLLYFLLTLGVLVFSAAIDGGEMMRYLLTGKRPDKEAIEGVAGLLAPLLLIALLVPLVMAYWFAPMLAAWYRLAPLKSLFFSLVACLLNWRAFVVYGLALMGIGLLVPLTLLLAGALLSQEASGVLGALLGVPLLMVLMPVVFASFYVSYRDVFSVSERV